MTLIVGVRCQDSVVVAADSAATFGNLGQPTVAQPTDKKIEILDDRVILAVSGPVGLGQRFRGALTQLMRDHDKRLRGESWQVMTEIRSAFHPHIETEFQAATVAVPVIGNQAAANSALSASVVALATPKGGPTLFQFNAQGAPEESTAQLPFVCVGIGQILADPFIAFIKDVFWERGEFPTLPEGVFCGSVDSSTGDSASSRRGRGRCACRNVCRRWTAIRC